MTFSAYKRTVPAVVALLVLVLGAGSAEAVGLDQARVVVAAPESPAPSLIQAPPHMAAEIAAAQSYWGVAFPPLCRSAVIIEGVPASPGAMAEASTPYQGDSLCVMTVSPTPDAAYRCRVVVHEFGHWLGLGHVEDRLSPMFSGGSYWSRLPQCDALPGLRMLIEQPAGK